MNLNFSTNFFSVYYLFKPPKYEEVASFNFISFIKNLISNQSLLKNKREFNEEFFLKLKFNSNEDEEVVQDEDKSLKEKEREMKINELKNEINSTCDYFHLHHLILMRFPNYYYKNKKTYLEMFGKNEVLSKTVKFYLGIMVRKGFFK